MDNYRSGPRVQVLKFLMVSKANVHCVAAASRKVRFVETKEKTNNYGAKHRSARTSVLRTKAAGETVVGNQDDAYVYREFFFFVFDSSNCVNFCGREGQGKF